jgi:hypothetical protein
MRGVEIVLGFEGRLVILNSLAERLKRLSKDDFKGRHSEAWRIM